MDRTLVYEGMKVRSSDNRHLGRIVAVEADGIAIEHGLMFHDRAFARWDEVVEIIDDTIVVATHRPELGELNQKST